MAEGTGAGPATLDSRPGVVTASRKRDHGALENALDIVILAAALIFTYGLCSRLAEKTIITAPMVVVAVGLLLGPLAVLGIFLRNRARSSSAGEPG